MSARHHLAQSNAARMRAPLEDPLMRGFVERLEPVNLLAGRSPGFVWRLQTPDGDATAIRVFDDERLLFNLSVWESVEAFRAYVHRGDHAESLRLRRQWFEPSGRLSHALWWIPAGELPTAEEGRRRLELLWERGPTREAFHLTRLFPPPGSSDPVRREASPCGVPGEDGE